MKQKPEKKIKYSEMKMLLLNKKKSIIFEKMKMMIKKTKIM